MLKKHIDRLIENKLVKPGAPFYFYKVNKPTIMNTIIKTAIVAVTALTLYSCAGGMVVTARPEPPVYVRPVPPHPGWVWVDGDWYWRGGRYVYRQGYWAEPRGRVWIGGGWEHRGHGYYWRRGHWGR